MQLTIQEATDLAVRGLTRSGLSPENARTVADHLVDAALCGHEFSSLPRVLAIADELSRKPTKPGAIRVARENHCSAAIDGGDNVAYVVSIVAIDKAMEIARRNGMAVVTASNTWFSGRLAYYVERAARAGFVAMHTTNTTARVAPFGGIDRLMGTNPFAIAFPTEDDPLVYDIGTSATTWGDVVLARAKGEELPPDMAVDTSGRPTLDPQAALDGAFLPWGGQRGGALSLAIQTLAILAGSPVVVQDTSNYGLFFLVVDPDMLSPDGQFRARASELRRTIMANRPMQGVDAVRVPGDGSLARRKRSLAAGRINVDDKVYAKLQALAG
jgi:LDH2 family malate/lactate/ureidoglycolate dehydrogenase